MSGARHLLLAVTGHGLGHLAQVAPVVNRLRALHPSLGLVVESSLPRARLASRLAGPFAHRPVAHDFGMHMRGGALDVDVEASHAAWQGLAARFPLEVDSSVARLRADRPALILADVPWVTIAAGPRAGVPTAVLATFTWAHVLRAYCAGRNDVEGLVGQMLADHRGVDCFLAPTPAMDMPELPGVAAVGPIARVGTPRRAELRARLGLAPATRCVVVFLGGIDTPLDWRRFPRREDLCWVVPATLLPDRADFRAIEAAGWDYLDVVCSADALLTKPGYGSVVEAACSGLPLLLVPRGCWPEEPALVAWAQRHARTALIERETLACGAVLPVLDDLWAAAAPPRPTPHGIEEAVARLRPWLDDTGA